MQSSIFVCASLLLIGLVSIGQGYPNNHENQVNDLKARLASLIESSEESSESKRDEWFNAALKKRSASCTPCKPACSADELCTPSGVCTCPGGAGNSPCPRQSQDVCSSAQTAGVKPVVLITFGEGSSKYSSAKPASLGFSTDYPQVSSKVEDGHFTIVNQVPQDFTPWLGGGLDHTKQCAAGSSKGYMMVVNAMYAPNKDFFTVKANNLCVGLRYEFSFYAANIVKKGTNIQLPNFLVTVTSATGSKDVLASFVTGPLSEQPTLTWVKVGASFVATSTSVVASLNSITPGGSGNDFALDDITFVSCAPKSNGVCH